MKFLAILGAVNLMLASAVVFVVPLILSVALSPAWLLLYPMYLLLVFVFVCLVAGSDKDDDPFDLGKKKDGDE